MGNPIKVRKIEKALTDKGMEREEGGHHAMFRKAYESGPTLLTRISRGASEYPESLLAVMGRQLALKPAEVRDLVSCTLSEEAWDQMVAERCPDGVNPYAPFRRGTATN